MDSRVDPTAQIHGSAEIEPGATVGAGTRIWRRAHVRRAPSSVRTATSGRTCSSTSMSISAIESRSKTMCRCTKVFLWTTMHLSDRPPCSPTTSTSRATGPWQLSPTPVRFGASVGANATVICGNELGEHCLVAAGAVVTKHVLPHQLVLGNPAPPAGWVCRCGVVVSRAAERPIDLVCEMCTHDEASGR